VTTLSPNAKSGQTAKVQQKAAGKGHGLLKPPPRG
jgi:hypothetical protein